MRASDSADGHHDPRGFAGDLSQFAFSTEYRSLKNSPASSFYRPCLLNSISYKRAVGYFRSSVYLVVGESIVEFARRGGKISLICSPELSPEDIHGIATGYAKRSEVIALRLNADIDQLLSESSTSYPVQVLATLVATNVLDIKLAMRSDGRGIYHEKLGVFGDGLGHRVSFKGSSNETWSGWDPKGNIETIEVFCSWRGGLEAVRVESHERHFEALWSGNDPDIDVIPFPVQSADRLRAAALKNLDSVEARALEGVQPQRVALPHQAAAITAWQEQGRRGIFEHATGSGKTFTAILAIREHVAQAKPVIVLVPGQLLLEQWAGELRTEIPHAALIIAGGGYESWRSPSRLRGMTADNTDLGGRIVLATMHTAASDMFLANIRQGDHLLVVADEVHQIGSPRLSRFLSVDAGGRLGLSATPMRYGDPEGTSRIFDYFGHIVQPRITIQDAIRAGRLVDYEYYPHATHLSSAESKKWKKLSLQVSQELARQKSDDSGSKRLSERAKLLLIQRSRIAKKASAKVALASEIVRRHYQDGQHWLVYCEDQDQLRDVLTSLRATGFSPTEYHSSMIGDRAATMAWFRTYGGLLASIRCLDEGIDIPAVTHAVILASSQNPRQFIQRRGRVLRKFPGKHRAVIHDAIVVPVSLEDEPEQISLLKSEMVRSLEFARHATNATAGAAIRAVAISLGFDPDCLVDDGVEEENDEGEK